MVKSSADLKNNVLNMSCLSAAKISLQVRSQTVILLLILESGGIFVHLMELFLIFQ